LPIFLKMMIANAQNTALSKEQISPKYGIIVNIASLWSKLLEDYIISGYNILLGLNYFYSQISSQDCSVSNASIPQQPVVNSSHWLLS